MVSRGSTARATSTARCGESPVLGVFSASVKLLAEARAAASPQSLPSGAHSARRASRGSRSPTSSGAAGTSASRLGARDSASTGSVYGHGFGCSSTASSPTAMIRSACVDELALDQAADDAAGAQRMILGDHAFALEVVSTGAPRCSARRTSTGEALGPRARPGRPSGSAAWRGRACPAPAQVRPVGVGNGGCGSSGSSAGRSAASRVVSLAAGRNAPGRVVRRRHAHGAAHVLAYGLGVNGRVPLRHRGIERKLVEPLAQAGLVGGPEYWSVMAISGRGPCRRA